MTLKPPTATDSKTIAVFEALVKADPFRRIGNYGHEPAVATAYETDAILIVDANPPDEDSAFAALAEIGAGHRVHQHEAAFRELWPAIQKALR